MNQHALDPWLESFLADPGYSLWATALASRNRSPTSSPMRSNCSGVPRVLLCLIETPGRKARLES